jgi:hypothetical protein
MHAECHRYIPEACRWKPWESFGRKTERWKLGTEVRRRGSDLENKEIRGSMWVEPWESWEPAGSNPLKAKRLRFGALLYCVLYVLLSRFVFFQSSRFIGFYMRFVIPGSGQYISPTSNRQKTAFEYYELISLWRHWHPRNCRIISNIQ